MPKRRPSANAEQLKRRGNEFFRLKNYQNATAYYTQSLRAAPHSSARHKTLTNRSLCYWHLEQYELSLQDAEASIALNPGWAKAWFRKAAALARLQRAFAAHEAIRSCLRLQPGNQSIRELRVALDRTILKTAQHDMQMPRGERGEAASRITEGTLPTVARAHVKSLARLPTDLLLSALEFLPKEDLVGAAAVCSTWCLFCYVILCFVWLSFFLLML
jgi:tetratricopeptide (TPR) repeat protein